MARIRFECSVVLRVTCRKCKRARKLTEQATLVASGDKTLVFLTHSACQCRDKHVLVTPAVVQESSSIDDE